MPELPDGTVTLLFTDIEGSTRLLRELGDDYSAALAEHRRALREAFAAQGGVEVDTQGDAFFYAFTEAAAAAQAALAAQRALDGGPVRVRMGVHTGTPERTEEGYIGLDVHLGARIAASGHGGQVLLSRTTRDVLDGDALDLGEHRLKDFDEPVWVYQLGDGVFPPLKTISNTNLPRPVSTFVGREREVAELVALLRDGTRLVTLSGPGGSGKTRLAIESASELVGDFRNGVFWVALATLRDPALVLPTLARAIGAQGELAEHIGEREQLLLVDNLEQVIEAAPELAELLERCPSLKVLVTSRELLRVRGEVEFEVLPLAEPEAVELFCLRAQVAEGPAVEELCRRLDNMPLALELAAARTKALSPEQILERLSQRLDLLKGGRDAEPRQATLRGTIEWSHDLLTAEEQQLFARLSVFPSCKLEVAEAVCGADVDTLQSLVEKSLVRRTDERFWMLETIRAFATERLAASGEAEEVRRRHAEYFLGVAESTRMAVERIGTGPMRYEVALAEQDNFRAALDWALAGDPALGLRIAVELEQFWVSRDPYEGARRIEALLARAGDLPIELRAVVLRVFGGTSQVSGAHERAEPLYEESLALYERLGDEWGVVHLQHRLAVCAMQDGEPERARVWAEENLDRARAMGSAYLEAEALSMLSSVAHENGELERALELGRQVVEIMSGVGFTWFEAGARFGAAECAFELGRLSEAESGALAGLALCRTMGERVLTVYALTLLAAIARGRGYADRAGRLWGAAEAEEERAPIGWSKDDIERFRDQVVAGAEPAFSAAREAGWRLTLDEAIDYALSCPTHGRCECG